MLLRAATDTVRIIRGRDQVLHACSELSALCTQCDQPGVLDHLEYHFSLPGFRRKRPTLVLVEATTRNGVHPIAAVLVYEYMLLGKGLGVYAADFHGGARAVVAPRTLRPRAAFAAAQELLRRGSILIQLSYEGEESPERLAALARPEMQWASRVRQLSGYIALEPTFDRTLGQLGKRTRRNLRYYRKMAEEELGAHLVIDPRLTREEFLEFNRTSDYAVPHRDAASRWDTLHALPTPLLLGLRSSSGEWLSVLGGYHKGPDLLVEWQMNRSDRARYSLSTAARAFLIDHAVALQCRRLYFVRGTVHSIRNSMIPEKIVDVVVARKRTPGWLINRVASAGEDLPSYDGELPALKRYQRPFAASDEPAELDSI
jgi:hypothetical protein